MKWLLALALSLCAILPAAAQNLVTSPTAFIAVTPTVTPSSTYSAGNEVGGLLTFISAGVSPTYAGVLESVSMTVNTVQTGEFDLYLCTRNPTNSTWADKSTPSINTADKASCSIGPVKLTSVSSGLGTHSVYNATGLATIFGLPNQTSNPNLPSNLYGILVTPSQPSAQFGSASDITVTLGILQ